MSESKTDRKTFTLDEAIAEAVHCHAGQVDKQGEPYILHPLRVMLRVLSDARIVAVLHDTLEDTHISPAYLARRMQTIDYEALTLLTRRPEDSYDEYIERIVTTHSTAGDIAREVKCADLQDNLSRMTPAVASLGPRYLRGLARIHAEQESHAA